MTVARLPRRRVVAAACALALGSIGACSPRAAANPGRPAKTDSAGVLVDTLTVRAPLQLPAQLYVEHDATIVARSAGTVDAVLADLGTRVAGGSLLAQLENAEQELAVAQAEATYENAGRLVNRARLMTKAGGVTPASSAIVGARSLLRARSSIFCPPRIPGPHTTRGTRIDSS